MVSKGDFMKTTLIASTLFVAMFFAAATPAHSTRPKPSPCVETYGLERVKEDPCHVPTPNPTPRETADPSPTATASSTPQPTVSPEPTESPIARLTD